MKCTKALVVALAAAGLALGVGTARADHHEGAVSLPETAAGVRPILVGTQAPDGPLVTSGGEATSLRTALNGNPGVVVFYRGHW